MLPRSLNAITTSVLFLSLVVLIGCQQKSATDELPNTKPDSAATETDGLAASVTDPAEYEFHRDSVFSDVAIEMPDGSVDV